VRPAAVAAAAILLALIASGAIAAAEPTLRTPKSWNIEAALPAPSAIDPYAVTFHRLEDMVRDRPLWQKNDLLVTLLHDDKYLTIESGKLSGFAPGAIFFVGPAGGGSSGTVFALRVPF
jgi:hypothetical protein